VFDLKVSEKLDEYELELNKQCSRPLIVDVVDDGAENDDIKAEQEATEFTTLASLFQRSRSFMDATCSKCDSFVSHHARPDACDHLASLSARVRGQLDGLEAQIAARRCHLEQVRAFRVEHAQISHFLASVVDARCSSLEHALTTRVHQLTTLRPLVEQCDELERELSDHQAQHGPRLARSIHQLPPPTRTLDAVHSRYANERVHSLCKRLEHLTEQMSRVDAHADRLDDWFSQTKRKLKGIDGRADLAELAHFYDEMRRDVDAHRHLLADVHRHAQINYDLTSSQATSRHFKLNLFICFLQTRESNSMFMYEFLNQVM
jgi:hypothetical protein